MLPFEMLINNPAAITIGASTNCNTQPLSDKIRLLINGIGKRAFLQYTNVSSPGYNEVLVNKINIGEIL